MPLHLHRYQSDRQDHFLTFSCHDRLPYLSYPAAYTSFLSALSTTLRTYRFDLYGYVLMPEHVHLLVTEPVERPLSTAIQALKVSVAKRSTQRPFWLPRYYDRNIRNRSERTDVLEYIHDNPVKRGLVASPEEWPWSSYGQLALGAASEMSLRTA
jgi:putative transposase